MRCIFCKKDSSDSVSIEHIIPESLGNKKSTLPKGAVCDSCNNYFASKIEKHVLESGEFKHLRSNQVIKNKKGKFQEVTMLFEGQPVRVRRTDTLNFSIHPNDFDKLESHIQSKNGGTLMLPVSGDTPSKHHMSRFLAKMGLEALASRWLGNDGWNDYLVDHEGFDPIRKFVREPNRGEHWEFSKRRIYEENSNQAEKEGVGYQVIYEWDILATGTPEASEFYFVFAIFGMEYAINLGGNCIEGYKEWLQKNNDISPLLNKSYSI